MQNLTFKQILKINFLRKNQFPLTIKKMYKEEEERYDNYLGEKRRKTVLTLTENNHT